MGLFDDINKEHKELRKKQDIDVLQTASSDNSNLEILLSGTADNVTRVEGTKKSSRMVFNPSIGALAGGYDQWGLPEATANGGFAWGQNTHATGQQAVAINENTYASGENSYARGKGCRSTAFGASSWGEITRSSAHCASAGGYGVEALRDRQFVYGTKNNLKFANTGVPTNGDGFIFGIQDNNNVYSSDTTITDGYNGCSGEIRGNAIIYITINSYAVYILTYATFDVSNGNNVAHGMYMVIGEGTNSNVPSSSIIKQYGTHIGINYATNNRILITNDGSDYITEFNLIRIM